MVDVIYKCKCMKEETTISVPDRRPMADLMLWMDCVTYCIGMDHKSLSPHCFRDAMEFAKIPYDETSGLVGKSPSRQ